MENKQIAIEIKKLNISKELALDIIKLWKEESKVKHNTPSVIDIPLLVDILSSNHTFKTIK